MWKSIKGKASKIKSKSKGDKDTAIKDTYQKPGEDAPQNSIPLRPNYSTTSPTDTSRLQESVITVEFRLSGCSVCKDFDPRNASKRTDGLTEESWARKEYNIPSHIVAGEIDVENTKSMIDTAQNGCIYCLVVLKVLDGVRPGWRDEDTFLKIFVANELPVVIRLGFGKTSRVPATEEWIRSAGIVLPPGRTMYLTITTNDLEKPAIEIELYRDTVQPCSVLHESGFGVLTDRIGYALERSDRSDAQQCFDFVTQQMNHCTRNGRNCGRASEDPPLPDRLLWLRAPSTDGISLVDTKGQKAKYVTLSYCWGPDKTPFLTSMTTIKDRMAGIQLSDLPQLFRDVISIVRSMNIEYLWIDRLCIIQGSDEDFAQQAPKMGEIYGQSTLTIVAASANSEMDTILRTRDIIWESQAIESVSYGLPLPTLRYRKRSVPLGKENYGGNYGRVSTRAWIWQERLLSARSIFYTDAALRYECHCFSSWESSNPTYLGHSWSAQIDNFANAAGSHVIWTKLVEEFFKRDIRYASDRLPAIEAVMKRVSAKTHWTPVYGLWKDRIIESLTWTSSLSSKSTARPTNDIPTWSWASIDGPISYRNLQARAGALYESTSFEYTLKCLGISGEQLIIQGQLITASIRQSCDENSKIIYEIGSEETNQWWEITNDVPIVGYDARFLNGETIRCSRRVDPDEAIPTGSWMSKCYCILVGKTQQKCETLVVGLSRRSLNSFERLGMLSALHPAAFEGVPDGKFVVV